MKLFKALLALLAALGITAAQAENVQIRALFQPDPARPNNTFLNTTPNSGFCAFQPGECLAPMFSLESLINFGPSSAIEAGTPVSIKVPANWRQLEVRNSKTGEVETVEVRITAFGSQHRLHESANTLVGSDAGHADLWTTGSWTNAPSPCGFAGIGAGNQDSHRFFWKTPVEAPCTKVAKFRIPSLTFESLNFAYEFNPPNPQKMSSGIYTGSINYQLGPDADFDIGGLYASDSNLTLDFELEVQHTLKVEIPPGGSKVSLEPEGGWQSWIEQNRKPTRIFRDQPFHLSASSRFKIMMQCDSTGGSECALRTNDGLMTTVETLISLPNGLTQNAAPVKRMPLKQGVWLGYFQPGAYVDRQIGTLHFEMPKHAIDALLQSSGSRMYRGDITVIWDSEV